MSCNSAPTVNKNSDISSFEKIQYSKQFGILNFENSRQIFYLNGKDTQWGQLFQKKMAPPKIAVLSTVFAGFLELLNQQQNIVAVDNEKYYSDAIIQQRIKDNKIVAVGEEGQIQVEKLLKQQPVFVIGSTFESGNAAMQKQLENLGVKLLLCDNFKEQHPLARAEWIKFFGVITGQFEMADSLFEAIALNYNKIVAKSDVNSVKYKPNVMADAMYGSSWYVPGGNSFTAKLIEDAGGNYVFKEKQPLFSYPLTLEDVLLVARNSDIWIHTNHFYAYKSLLETDRRYALFKPFINRKIYNNSKLDNRNGGNDYWEKGVGRPDLILSDLFTVFHKDSISNDDLTYYQMLD